MLLNEKFKNFPSNFKAPTLSQVQRKAVKILISTPIKVKIRFDSFIKSVDKKII